MSCFEIRHELCLFAYYLYPAIKGSKVDNGLGERGKEAQMLVFGLDSAQPKMDAKCGRANNQKESGK